MNSKEYYVQKRNSLPNSIDRDIKQYSFEELDNLNIQTVHFTAVCGKAMASLAGMLIEAGFNVTGSDCECYPPMSQVVKESGIDYQDGFNERNILQADVVVVGNACMFSNIEASKARRLQKPQLSVAEALHYFILRNRKSVVVTGTHGKTTTTSYLAEAFYLSQLNPSFLVGGVVQEFATSYKFSENSEYVLVEGDEYDSAYFDKRPKFFHYDPYILIITSVEFDHADIFKDEEDYKNAFRMLLNEKKDEGVVIACVDDKNIKSILQEVNISSQIVTYGILEGEYRAVNISENQKGQVFDIETPNGKIENILIPLFGDHNIKNSLAVFLSLNFLGIDINIIKSALASFCGVKERQEKIGEEGGIVVMRDYAHHPTAVKETLIGLRRQYSKNRIVVVFEPRSTTSRKRMFEIPYAESFLGADCVLFKNPAQRIQDNANDFLSSTVVEEHVQEHGIFFQAFDTYEEILDFLLDFSKKEDLIVFMSNGDFGGLPFELLAKLEKSGEK